MLKEIEYVRQVKGEPERRWFNSHDMDLIIWLKKDRFLAFQFCYDKEKEEKALSWKPATGLLHERVDNGESRDGHYKATPILLQNGSYDLEHIRRLFEKNAARIDAEVRDFVLEHLR